MAGTVRDEFDIPLNARGDVIRVRIVRDGRAVVDFVVQYEAMFDGRYLAVVRYDGSHGRPHRDLLGWDGATIEKTWLPIGTRNNEVLTAAILAIRGTWENLRTEFALRRP